MTKQGTIVLVAQRGPLSALTGQANAAVSCISMPIDHDVATAPWSGTFSRVRRRSTREAISTSAASTCWSWPSEFGTPLFVYDEDHLRQACREAVAAWGDGVAYATKAFLCRAMARLAHEEGMHLDVASGGELHVALSAGVPPDRLVLHGNNKSTDELAHGPRAGRRAGSSSTRSTRSPAWAPCWTPPRPTRRPEGPGAGHSRCRGPHARVRANRAGGLEVRLLRLLRRRGRGRCCARAHAGRRTGRRPCPYRQPGLRRVFLRAGGGGARRVLRPARLPELVVGGGLGVPYVNGESAPTQADWAEATRSACTRAGVDAARGSPPSRAVRSSPPPASRSTPSGRSSTSRASAPTSASTAA